MSLRRETETGGQKGKFLRTYQIPTDCILTLGFHCHYIRSDGRRSVVVGMYQCFGLTIQSVIDPLGHTAQSSSKNG
jgi:hypothetical protein